MKKNQFRTWLALGVAIALTGCQQPKNNADITVETATAVRHISDSTGTYELRIDFPVVKNGEALAVALNEWISEQLGGTYGDAENADYTKALADTAALVDHYIKELSESNQKDYAEMVKDNPSFKEMGISYYDSLVIEKLAEGKNWVTFTNQRDVFLGGAHGLAPYFGQTFRKSDGRRIGWDVFTETSGEKFQQILKDGLVEYFGVSSEAELADHLMNEAGIHYIPLPQCPPLFTAEGVSFVYNQYEIAAYAAGLPSFTVGYDKLQPFMMTAGKRLVVE